MPQRDISILGVPLNLGSGLTSGEKSGAWSVRIDQLQAALERLGCNVENCGSLEIPTPEDPGSANARYLKEITETCCRIAEWMEERHLLRRVPLVFGGDHSIAAGTVAGTAGWFRKSGAQTGLI